MKWAWKLTTLAGIDIYVHATFFILVAWIGMSFWAIDGTIQAVITGVGFIVALFACVVLHEFGHALTARRYGIRTEKITLLPIGGVASMERMPDDPKQEIAVALAGPAVNLVIAAGLWLWLLATGSMVDTEQLSITEGSFLQRLMLINLMLAIFNMLPAFPMDGGRVLRAVLALNMDHIRATRIAASIGQGLALWLGFLGLLYNPFLIFIALFVWIGAASEAESEKIKSTISGASVGKAMLTDFQVLAPDDLLSHVVELTLAGSQTDFPVLKDNAMIGVLGQADLLRGLQQGGEQNRVQDFMQNEVYSADIKEPLEQVLNSIQSHHCSLVSVTEDGRFAGIVNLDNIIELIQIQTALNQKGNDSQTKWGA